MSCDEYDLRSASQHRSHLVIYESGVTQVNESYEWGKEAKMILKTCETSAPPPSPSSRGQKVCVAWSKLPSSVDHESLLITYVDSKSPDLKRANWRPNEQRCKALIDPLQQGTWIGEQVKVSVGAQNTMVTGVLVVSSKDYIVLVNDKEGRICIRNPNVVFRTEDKCVPTKCVKQAAQDLDTVGVVAVVAPHLRRLQLTYLANHVSWKAKYVLVISPNLKSVYMMNATACITNKTSTPLCNLTISLVSGQVRTDRSNDNNNMYTERRMIAPQSMAIASIAESDYSSPSTQVSSGNDRFDLKILYEIPAHQTIETDFLEAPKGVGLANPWFRYSVNEGATSRAVSGIPYGARVWTQTGDYHKLPSLPSGTWYLYSAAYGMSSNVDEKVASTIIGPGDFLGSAVLARQSHVNGYIDIPVGSTNHFLGGHNLQVQLTHQSADYVDAFRRNRTVSIHASFANHFDVKKMEASGQPPFDARDYVVEVRYDTRGQKVELMQVQGRVKGTSNKYMTTLYPPPINKETRLQEPVSLFGQISALEQATNPDSGFIRNRGVENGQLRILVGPIPEGETVELSFHLNVMPEMSAKR